MEKGKGSLSKDFVKVVNMEEEVVEYRRYAQIVCRGIPVKAWSRITMERIADVWCNLLTLKDDTEVLKEMEIAYLLIQIGDVKEMGDLIDLEFDSKWYSVLVKEVVFDFDYIEEDQIGKKDNIISSKKLDYATLHKLLVEVRSPNTENDVGKSIFNSDHSSKLHMDSSQAHGIT